MTFDRWGSAMDITAMLLDFDDIIIERGRAYFEEGRVTFLNEVSPGEFEATVEGSDEYAVNVWIDGDDEAHFGCDCPYYGAPYCKHVVAALLAIQEQANHHADHRPGYSAANDPLAADALGALPKDKLVSLIRSAATKFPATRDWMRVYISPEEDDINAHRERIRASIRSHVHRGYISHREMEGALMASRDAADDLNALVDSADICYVLDFALMVIEETSELYDCGDDSDGDVDDVIKSCRESLVKLLEMRVLYASDATQTGYFDRLMNVLDAPWVCASGFMRGCFIDQCIQIADGIVRLREPLMALREREMSDALNVEGFSRHYASKDAQKAYFALLRRWRGEDAARDFAAEHMENNDFCAMFYHTYCENQQHEKALDLCLMVEKNADALKGVACEWRNRRFAVYALMHDEAAQRALGETLFLAGDSSYYQVLKLLYSAQHWPQKREELLDKLEKTCGGWLDSDYLKIIIDEGDKPRLWAYVQAWPMCIFSLYRHLMPEYSREMQALFQAALREHAVRAQDRRGYRGVCERIAIYRDACGAALAAEIVREFQTKYLRKPAFQDELRQEARRIDRSR